MPFFRQLQHLLPKAEAWNVTKVTKKLRLYLEAYAENASDVRDFFDSIHAELLPATTTHLEEYEFQFNLPGTGSDATRRLALDAAWKTNGGQSPSYIQGVLHAAGFTNLYLHEWWSGSGPPYTARDPRTWTSRPHLGTFQCTGPEFPSTQPQCSAQVDADGPVENQPQCNRFLANDPGYLVNKRLTNDAPPPVPDDPTKWPFFIYFCGATFGTPAQIDMARRAELERLLLKICPTQHWIVLMIVDYDPASLGDFEFDAGGGWDNSTWVDI